MPISTLIYSSLPACRHTVALSQDVNFLLDRGKPVTKSRLSLGATHRFNRLRETFSSGVVGRAVNTLGAQTSTSSAITHIDQALSLRQQYFLVVRCCLSAALPPAWWPALPLVTIPPAPLPPFPQIMVAIFILFPGLAGAALSIFACARVDTNSGFYPQNQVVSESPASEWTRTVCGLAVRCGACRVCCFANQATISHCYCGCTSIPSPG